MLDDLYSSLFGGLFFSDAKFHMLLVLLNGLILIVLGFIGTSLDQVRKELRKMRKANGKHSDT